jgi:N-glycosylase/DNA lyase
MIAISPSRLREAVAAIYPEIEARAGTRVSVQDERKLWWELSCALLSSQVPFELAVAAADAVDARSLLLDPDAAIGTLQAGLAAALRAPVQCGSTMRRYRFPQLKARQLAATRVAVSQAAGSLRALLAAISEGPAARAWLVTNAPGLGPKQASMFLRNVGLSHDLAVLDRHVVAYMRMVGLYSESAGSVTVLGSYVLHELELRSHARRLGCSVGLLDWAIWIVMRAARENQREVTCR